MNLSTTAVTMYYVAPRVRGNGTVAHAIDGYDARLTIATHG